MLQQAKLLLKLYYAPLSAMSEIIDEGRWLFGALAVIVLSLSLQFVFTARTYATLMGTPEPPQGVVTSPPSSFAPSVTTDAVEEAEEVEEADETPAPPASPGDRAIGLLMMALSPYSDWMAILALALLYVPATILALVLIDDVGSFGVALQRDYGALLACALLAWAAAHLPALLVSVAFIASVKLMLVLIVASLAAKLYFAVLMVCALRRVFGTAYGKAAGVVSVSWVSMLAQQWLWLLASPCLLYYLYSYFRGDVVGIGAIFSGRKSFRRNLEASTLNPKDSEAHYQLGLIYQHRRQLGQATLCFQRAVDINHNELDAHFQLGRLARQQGRLADAIRHFEAVVSQDDTHARSEIWREVGATYAAASMHEEAEKALATYVARRPYDPEGLYLLGITLHKLARATEAEALFQRCIEAVKTMPYHRRGQTRRWGRLADKQLHSIKVEARTA